MSLTDGGVSLSDIAAVTNGRDGFGGNDGAWWLIILFLFAFAGGWNRNGFGGNGGNDGGCGYGYGAPYMVSDVQRGFDQSAVMSSLNGINSAISTGFANAEVSRCNSQANILQTLNNNQAATLASMNGLASQFANCCCENRLGLANLGADIAREACADRAAVSDGVRDIIANQNAGIQTIIDKLCQQEIDALKTQNANLQTQINLANMQASQTAQTARILADNAAQTSALEQYLNPAPIPAYVVQNPNCCSQNYCGCGCGSF
jgi:hypothetical protein